MSRAFDPRVYSVLNLGVNEFDTALYCDPHMEVDVCAASGTSCSYFDDNTNHGTMTFDRFLWTCIAILQAITFDGWTLSM